MGKRRIPVISFFTGGGFLDLGFESAGYRVAWTNEANPTFAKMFSHGMTAWRRSKDKDARPAAISEIAPIQDLRSASIVKSAFGTTRPRIFGVIGGPPCIDFSNAGKNFGGRGRHGRLSRIYVEHICRIRPTFFVLENVKGMVYTKRHRAYLKGLEEKLESKGYRLDLRILNALDLGVPQDRERVVLIGIRSDLASKCAKRELKPGDRDWFPWPYKRKYQNAKTKFPWPGKVRRGGRAIKPKSIPYELTVASALNGGTPMSRLPNGKEAFIAYSKRFRAVREGDTKRKSFKRLHRHRYSPTACYGHNEVHLHPWKPRRLTVREAMRLQGIPDTYELPKEIHLGAKFSLVSNGVPVPLAKAVAESIQRFLDRRKTAPN